MQGAVPGARGASLWVLRGQGLRGDPSHLKPLEYLCGITSGVQRFRFLISLGLSFPIGNVG